MSVLQFFPPAELSYPFPIDWTKEASEARVYLAEESSAAGLDGLNLGEVDGLAAEAGGKLGNVKEDAVGGVDGTQLGAGEAADARLAGANSFLKGAVLLGVVAVGAEIGVTGGARVGGEALRELARGRGGVRLGGVVNGGGNGARTNELDQGLALGVSGSLAESARGEHDGRVCVRFFFFGSTREVKR